MWELQQFLENEMSPGLVQDFMDGYLKYNTLLQKNWSSMVVVTAGYQAGVTSSIPLSGQFLIPVLQNSSWEAVGAENMWSWL